MAELAAAARQPGLQGKRTAYCPLSSCPQVAPPDAQFSGSRPVIDVERVTVKNLLLPRWFLKDPDQLLSDQLKPRPQHGLAAAEPDDTLMNFRSADQWLQATSALALYAAKTVPPLMGPVQQQAHMQYCLELKDDMVTHDVATTEGLLQLYVNFDEQLRRHIVDAAEELTFADPAADLRRSALELPRERLGRRAMAKLREQLAAATAKADAAATAANKKANTVKNKRQEAAGTEQTRKSGFLATTSKKMFGVDVPLQFLMKTASGDANAVCLHWNMKKGCTKESGTCPHSHHCMTCGKEGCRMDRCKGQATPKTPAGSPPTKKAAEEPP